MSWHPRKGNSGFSLVEILIVLVILTILGLLLFPAISRATDSARQAACVGNLRQMAAAFQLYAGENNGKLPTVVTGVQSETWYNQIGVYAEKKSVAANEGIFVCPGKQMGSMEGTILSGHSYGMDRSLSTMKLLAVTENLDAAGNPVLGKRWLVVDAAWYFIDPGAGPGSSASTTKAPQARHGGKMNVLFPDGAVRSMKPQEANSDLFLFKQKPMPLP